MLPSELAKRIRQLEIRTRKEVTDVLSGEYKSAFRGTGMEFDEVREYQPGDDVRSIDWNVTARQGRPFIKRFQEERELTVFFAVDLSASGLYGAGQTSKNDLAAELCATLAFSAVKNNDKVGLLLFTDRTELFIPPVKGTTSAMRLIREVLAFQPQGKGTDLAGAMDFLARVLKKRAVVFLISDFIGGGDYDKPLQLLARRHDFVALQLDDDSEEKLPDAGLVELEDAETGEIMLLDTASPKVRLTYEFLFTQRQFQLANRFQRLGVDHLRLTAGHEFTRELAAFLKRRIRARK
ncbi:MAG: DUF58 domain-containing protein [Victivallales bacterium]|nr:DUF58 domain-containing protein [Victivallales bacterium]